MIEYLQELNRRWFMYQFGRIYNMEAPIRQSFYLKYGEVSDWDYEAERNATLLYRMEKKRLVRDYLKVDNFLRKFKRT
jgi:hypothetical protein